MPSSIKLSVILTEQSEATLTDIGLQHPWRDLLRNKIFASQKPPNLLDLEDIAILIEDFIEDMFQRQYGDQGDEIQVQVYTIMDEGRTREFAFQDKVDQCLKPGDTIIMAVSALSQKARLEFTEQMIEQVRSKLRFGLNDRVLCFCGPRHFSGHVVGTAVPDDGDLLPYLVKTDALPGLPTRTISVPSDHDGCCVQEVCFESTQLGLVRSAASFVQENRKPKLRFALGDKVVCRIRNNPADGLENWVAGVISEAWPSLGAATWDMGELSGKFPETLPYKVDLALGNWVYCQRDDHTLIRREGMQPITRVKGISKRMEVLTEADGGNVCIDHVTGRRKRMLDAMSDSD